MTDARLLATNPENSSLVPVACNAQGQLLVNEVVIEGIDNDVTVNGDLDVTGAGDFAGDVTVGKGLAGGYAFKINAEGNNGNVGGIYLTTNPSSSAQAALLVRDTNQASIDKVKITTDGAANFAGRLLITGKDNGGNSLYINDSSNPGVSTITLSANGSSTFANDLTLIGSPDGPSATSSNLNFALTNVGSTGYIRSEASGSGGPGGFGANMCFYTKEDASGGYTKALTLGRDGAATFAGGKAGFTADGNLWCTTRRGDTVILDATSNGLASWADYTPPSRRDLIKDKLDALEEGRGDVSSQELDET